MDFDKHRNAQELNLDEIANFLKNNGFVEVNLNQQWRHITGSVVKNGTKLFFKLASTEGVAERTKNEFAWNKLINNEQELELPVSIPRIYESGKYNGLFWFTCEFVEGAPLAQESQSGETKKLENNLSKIALTAKIILEFKSDKYLPNDERKNDEKEDPKTVFLDRIKHWMGQFDNNVDDLYDFIEKRIEYGQKAPQHGDFVPWHIFTTNKNKLFLIDGEHSKIAGFKFYDIAYFYHRVYTKLKRPDIANKFLKEFNNIYQFSKADKECFRLILAQRVIGGYFDSNKCGEKNVDLHDELKRKILEGKITIG